MRLLFVEDEPDLREVLKKQLQASGYSVDACGDGLEALDYARLTAYDAIILDIMLPGLDGLSVLQKLRAVGTKTPVLLLTARGSVEDRVAGLDLGADDYLVKPFAFDELVARLRVLLRRSGGQVSNVLRCGDLEMDIMRRSVVRSAVNYSCRPRSLLYWNICCAIRALSWHAKLLKTMSGLRL